MFHVHLIPSIIYPSSNCELSFRVHLMAVFCWSCSSVQVHIFSFSLSLSTDYSLLIIYFIMLSILFSARNHPVASEFHLNRVIIDLHVYRHLLSACSPSIHVHHRFQSWWTQQTTAKRLRYLFSNIIKLFWGF